MIESRREYVAPKSGHDGSAARSSTGGGRRSSGRLLYDEERESSDVSVTFTDGGPPGSRGCRVYRTTRDRNPSDQRSWPRSRLGVPELEGDFSILEAVADREVASQVSSAGAV